MNRPDLSIRLALTDALLLTLITGLALWPLADAYDGQRWLVAAVLGLGLAIGATLLARALRWGPVLTVLGAALGFLIVGPAAAAPLQAVGGVLPGPDAERVLLTGVVRSWRTVLTLPVPLGSARGELVVPFLTALVAGLIVLTLLWRSRFAGWTWLPVAMMFGVAAAFGTHETGWTLVRGLLLVVVLLTWLRWRSLRALRASWTRRVVLGTAAVGLAAGAASGLAVVMAGDDGREVLRDHIDPPLAKLEFKSPLAKYRDYYKNQKAETLFTFSGLPADAPEVRLATMDTYDGLVWNVSTTDLESGTSAFRAAPDPSGRSVHVTVGAYDGPWVPTVGTGTGALVTDNAGDPARELLLNSATGAVVHYGDARPDDEIDVSWTPRGDDAGTVGDAPADRSVPLMPMSFSIDKLDALARRWTAGARTDLERANDLVRGLTGPTSYFTDGLDPVKEGYSPSGHGAARLQKMFANPDRIVGNDEQYASAMAYAAQKLGLPARVVLGFEDVEDGPVTGDDIAAWVEIPFQGHGWVRFDPTPSEDQKPPPESKDPNPIPQPYIVQPPVLPQEPADVQGVPPEGSGTNPDGDGWGILGTLFGVLWTLLKLALITSPLWAVVLIKALRRRRRRRHADPVARLSGAWREMTDRARDFGTRLVPAGTRQEHGLALSGRFPAVGHVALAVEADRHVFGPATPTDEAVAAYWNDVDTALRRMRKAVPWWRRPLAWFSPASLPVRAFLRQRAEQGKALGRSAGRRTAAVGRRVVPAAVRSRLQPRRKGRA